MSSHTMPSTASIAALDPDRVARAVAKADLRPLLMTLFHRTGDTDWFSERFRPRRDAQLISDEDAGISDAAAAEIRLAACTILSRPESASVSSAELSDALFHRMMEFYLNEAVPEEYVPMMREQLGFRSVLDGLMDPARPAQTADIAIIGAGQSGVALGACFKDLDIPFKIFDRRHDIGGVWSQNIYPGCGVDTPNYAYSFSFGPRHPWSRNFSPQQEVKDYLQLSAGQFGLTEGVEFNSNLLRASWDETLRLWHLKFDGPDGPFEVQVPFLVTATGLLSNPIIPNIAGIDEFEGDLFHSADWPEGFDVAGKRFAIIGTGASAMQIVPTIADQVSSLAIYQRTPQWVRPIARYHEPIDSDVQWLLQNESHYAAWTRFGVFWRYGDGLLRTLKIDPDWEHPERAVNRTNDRHRQATAEHVRAKLASRPDLIEKCLPDYPIFGKRILLDNGWYDALLRSNVTLLTDPIARIEGSGIRTEDGTLQDFDVIVMSTGFDVAASASRLNITGRNGKRLVDLWAGDNPSAYLGLMVPDFPNLFIMQGPGTGLGHGGSAIFVSECQAHFISRALGETAARGAATIEVRQEPYAEYVRNMDEAHQGLIWSHPGMQPYYRNSSGRVHSVMPWRLVDYYNMTHGFAEGDFVIE